MFYSCNFDVSACFKAQNPNLGSDRATIRQLDLEASGAAAVQPRAQRRYLYSRESGVPERICQNSPASKRVEEPGSGRRRSSVEYEVK